MVAVVTGVVAVTKIALFFADSVSTSISRHQGMMKKRVVMEVVVAVANFVVLVVGAVEVVVVGSC